MAAKTEYYNSVKQSIPASVALFALLFLLAIFSSPRSYSQVNSGAHMSSGAPPTAITHAPPTALTNAPPTSPGLRASSSSTNRNHTVNHQHNLRRAPVYGGIYAVGVPVPAGDDASTDPNNDDANYQGGPTIFDRRGSGAQSYIPPVANPENPHSAQSYAAADPAQSAGPESDPDPTLLVFKDGHQLEVGNYAIVGKMLYDMTPGHSRKVAVAELDLAATQKQNEARGVIFQLPPSALSN